MPVLNEDLTGHKNIRKINVRNYIIFYVIDEENSKARVLRIGHAFMDWVKYYYVLCWESRGVTKDTFIL